jgi:sarcosine oxidase subunit gamma
LRVQRPDARELLSKGCGLDLHPRFFAPDQCARTRFAQIPVVIDCLNGPSRFELYVARSHLSYLHSWLVDAAAEFDVSASE